MEDFTSKTQNLLKRYRFNSDLKLFTHMHIYPIDMETCEKRVKENIPTMHNAFRCLFLNDDSKEMLILNKIYGDFWTQNTNLEISRISIWEDNSICITAPSNKQFKFTLESMEYSSDLVLENNGK